MSRINHPSFNHAEPLTEDQLRTYAPSIFATTAHKSRSDRFTPIATIDVLRGLHDKGFDVVAAMQSRTRDPDRKPFTKHMLRLRRFNDTTAYKVGDTIFEVGLKNGNDGSCCWDIFAGLFGILCLNGMVAPVGKTQSFKVRHTGDAMARVIEGSFEVLDQAKRALKAVKLWGAIELHRDEQMVFAEAAHAMRFTNVTAIKPAQLLEARRITDSGTDLWKTFNVVQENTLKGGLSAVGPDANMRMRRFTSRAIRGVDQDVKLNRALFVLADKVAVAKGAEPLTQMAEAA